MIDSEFIISEYFSVSPWDGVSKIQSKLNDFGFAVVEDSDGFWGILTTNDIIKANHNLVVDCLFSLPYINITDNFDFIINLMDKHKVNILPCINNKKFVGLICRETIINHNLKCPINLEIPASISQIQNINNRITAEKAFVQSQNKLRAIIDNVPFHIFWKDVNSKYLGCNKQFAKFVGMTVEEVIGKTDYDMPWHNYAALYITDDLEILKSKKAKLNKEKINENSKNQKFWSNTHKVPLLNTENEVISIIGIFEDITEKKKLQDELNTYRNHLEFLVKERTSELNNAQRIAKIGNWKINISTNNLYCSDEVYNIFEKGSSICKFAINDFDRIVHPDDKDMVLELYQKSIQNQTSFSIEHRIKTLRGKIKWVHIKCENHFDLNNRHSLSIGTIQDITARKAMELELKRKDDEFQHFFENINEAVILLDSRGETIYVNKKFETIFGIKNLEQYNNSRAFTKEVHAEDQYKLNEIWRYFIDIDVPSNEFSVEFRIKLKDDENKWLFLKGIPVFESNSKVHRIILLISDISKNKQVQREILNAIISAEEKERTRFAQDLHDGIGPLLSTVKLYIQWLNRPESTTDKTELLKLAEKTIDEALSSTREISHNLSPYILTRYGLTAALINFIDRFKKSKKININIKHNLNCRFDFEIETTLYRIAVECINNALRYSKAAEINIEIKLTENNVSMSITDNGVGFNLDEVMKSKQGLGLFNVYNRVETIGGKIKIDTFPQKGTSIMIVIPSLKELAI